MDLAQLEGRSRGRQRSLPESGRSAPKSPRRVAYALQRGRQPSLPERDPGRGVAAHPTLRRSGAHSFGWRRQRRPRVDPQEPVARDAIERRNQRRKRLPTYTRSIRYVQMRIAGSGSRSSSPAMSVSRSVPFQA